MDLNDRYKISNNFWGDPGLSIVEEYIKHSKDSTHYLGYYMKERCRIEESYAKDLQLLLKNTQILKENGTANDAWAALRTETEEAITNSRTFAETVREECFVPLSKHKDYASKKRKITFNDGWKLKKENERMKNTFQKKQESYSKSNEECKKAQDTLELAKKNQKKSADLLKLKGKAQKAARDMLMLEKDCEEYCVKLANFQEEFAEKMVGVLDAVQQQEIQRVSFVSDKLSAFCLKLRDWAECAPKSARNLRRVNERISGEKDVRNFVKEKRTSTPRPQKNDIKFDRIRDQPFDIFEAAGFSQDDVKNHNKAPQDATKGMVSSVGIQKKEGGRPDSIVGHPSDPISNESSPVTPSSRSKKKSFKLFKNKKDKKDKKEEKEDKRKDDSQEGIDLNSVGEDQSSSGVPVLKRMKAMHDFSGRDEFELDFFKDDVVDVYEVHVSGWWSGELKGRVGLFPSNFFIDVKN